MVHNVGEATVRAESNPISSNNIVNGGNPISSNNIVNGELEAKSVLMYLGVEFDNSLEFEDLIKMIEQRQYFIINKYGVPITLLKDIYNLNSPMERRVKALNGLLKGLLKTE